MKESTIKERSSPFEVDAKRFASIYADSDSSGGELSDDSSHVGDHRSQLMSRAPPRICLSPRSMIYSRSGDDATTTTRVSFDALSNDLLLFILGFCDTASTRKMTQANHRLRNIIASEEAAYLRREICRQEWPWINKKSRIVDDLHVPLNCIHEAAAEPNVLFLMSLASQKMSCRISLTILRHRMKTFSSHAHLHSLELADGRHAIQYRGPIGEGNRSIQADRALPRPQKLTMQQIRRSAQLKKDSRPRSALHTFFHRIYHRVPQHERPFWRPFVAPFKTLDGVHLTPRLISYFEVSIEIPPDNLNDASFRFVNHLNGPLRQRPGGDCIVVGLSTRKFRLQNRMAGWDDRSFGYHSDDGGIYHNQGQMVRKYGPTFGAGDTVGCGVDYQRRAIFFTLNGKFLGYAFEKVSLKMLGQDLYPVVGLDTHCPVACNFGCQQGFLFDLKSVVCSQRSIVFQSMLVDQVFDL